jgi:hypothetical protein
MINPVRANAFFQLAMRADNPVAPTLIPLIGSPQPVQDTNVLQNVLSTATLTRDYNLAAAKKLSHDLQCMSIDDTPRRRGRAIVVDFLNYPESRAVADAMQNAGLSTKTKHFIRRFPGNTLLVVADCFCF